MRFLFEDYALDTDRRELQRATDVIVVTPQVFDLLEYLIRNRERVVSKDDLINAVWKGRIVSDAALTTRLNAARSAIGDTGEKQHLIKTLPRKGFRFVGAVQEARGPANETVGPVERTDDTAPRLSIVVLPFANLSDDRERDYFVDGITESLTTDLSRINGSFVIARNSAASYKGKAVDVRQVGRELNVRYVLEGSVQRSGKRLRMNVQLIDAKSGQHLWADRFEKPVVDLFDMQDEIVSRLANTLGAQLIEAEARRAERTLHPDAMDLYFQGRAWLMKGFSLECVTQARSFFERSLEFDPGNVEAMIGLASVDTTIAASFTTDDGPARLAAAEAMVNQALSIRPNYTSAHSARGWVQIFTNRAAQGIREFEHALALDSNRANAHAALGFAKFYMGRGAETEGHVLEALRLSPRDVEAYQWTCYVGVAKLQLGSDVEAVSWLRRSTEANRNFPLAHVLLAAALGLTGTLDEARAAARTGLALNSGFTIRRLFVAQRSDNPIFLAGLERVCEGLRLAGVPEG
ncbi:winged helix-turn-helix domain-containing protein [Bradyrhizobium sp. CCGB01]|uniref:winged helix-turn-helix domain-containing tetratricopeptide repeat protein n=1 Tax=Bradyrhizobium sp. CCGB01 TaxID=2949634 RepID=UPI0020B30385|nr:winged helix-turn-helix domain-containing protein [Bradyrhizobium sp. CCGB01]MCP3406732.1 winged helix-turn-helix domain-containing protein [Bradyrhizobium sp. CCGB01]